MTERVLGLLLGLILFIPTVYVVGSVISGQIKLRAVKMAKAAKPKKVKRSRIEKEQAEADKRLAEAHARHVYALEQFDIDMESSLPHSEHAPKTRLSPPTGCRECEADKKRDQEKFNLMIESI